MLIRIIMKCTQKKIRNMDWLKVKEETDANRIEIGPSTAELMKAVHGQLRRREKVKYNKPKSIFLFISERTNLLLLVKIVICSIRV